MTTTADGFSDGQWEQYLSAPPPYQSGTFGNYYLPNSTPLYGAGSTNAATLGLYHYTTQTNQFKEGNEAANHNVNIGLHYVAANVSGGPLDSDNDGIPDYAENWHGDGNYQLHTESETDWTTNYTISGVWDPTNSIYDDSDLSGNGIVGRIKKAFGMGPFDASNPFTLTLSTNGNPQVAMFGLPLNYGTLTNIADVRLWLDGGPATIQWSEENNANGLASVGWNTVFDSPGQHLLQPRIYLRNTDWSTAVDGNNPTTTAVGPLLLFGRDNALQFDSVYTSFDRSGATLYAQTLPGTSYTISLTDPSGNPLTNFTGNADTSSGVISVPWDFTEGDGSTYNGTSFTATFSVTPPGADVASQYSFIANLVGLGYDGGTTGDFTTAYSWSVPAMCGKNNVLDVMIQSGATDPLLLQFPSTGYEFINPYPYYSAAFNIDSLNDPSVYGNPGWIAGTNNTNPEGADLHHTVGELMNSLSTATGLDGWYTRNFYWWGHGLPNWIGNDMTGGDAVDISSAKVAVALGNFFLPPGTNSVNHPYRFVFLDACQTEADFFWADSFGIPPKEMSDDWAKANPAKANAIFGFTGDIAPVGPMNASYYEYTLQTFFGMWQNPGDKPLVSCVDECSHTNSLFKLFQNLGFGINENQIIPIGELKPNAEAIYGEAAFNKFYGYKYITRVGIAPPH
jgi:hypothetical protein